MGRIFLRSKVHRATVTESNLEYEGSITLDVKLMEAAGMASYEQIHVLNLSNGSRLATYVIPGKRGSGVVCMNGAAARMAHKGDRVILLTYEMLEPTAIRSHRPTLVYVDPKNKIVKIKKGGA